MKLLLILTKTILFVIKKQDYPKDELTLIYETLIFSLRNFIKNINAKGIILGISGGIDSSLTLAIALDALGEDNIIAVSLPSEYTSELSKNIIKQTIENTKIDFKEIAIINTVKFYENNFNKEIDFNINNTLENLQSRIRGQILMAIANNNPSHLLLTTGNKSELATGYSTLYGDSCGAFNVLKDLYKTEVFCFSKMEK